MKGVSGLKVVHETGGKRYEGDLVEVVNATSSRIGLSRWGREVARKAATLIMEAEKEVHGGESLHELGEIDTVVDIVGTVKALEELNLQDAEFLLHL
ncbi:MAG: nickel insertion protein [Candidatus Methanomethylicaceae archaeon]